jgi:hypothetical protein
MARWNSCNILHVAPDAKRLWQFDAKGGGVVLAREQRVPHTEPLPPKFVAKNWTSLWQPKLNIAWLPPENIFLRVVELPASSAEETVSMVELQLEKLSPLPVAQVVWTLHVLGTRLAEAKGDAAPESLQTVIVVIVSRSVVEEFLGKLERDGYLADRLEVPMLDQLAVVAPTEDSTWLFPLTLGGQSAALIAWWFGGVLRNISFITIPAAGDRVAELKSQLSLLAMAGEVDGWMTSQPRWHLVADPVNAAEWENLLRNALGEPVETSAPPALAELAARTAKRATAESKINLLPPEFTARYHQQFVDRLWLRGLAYAGAAYAVFLVIYFCAVGVLGYRTHDVEQKVALISNDYTNAMQLRAKFAVLSERAQLKYAALDCWQITAQQIPQGIALQRLGFSDGKKLALGGTTTPDLINTLFAFNKSMRNATLNGQPVFDPQKGEPVNPRLNNGIETWSCSLELLHTEAEQP